jgi:hypothetical protein
MLRHLLLSLSLLVSTAPKPTKTHSPTLVVTAPPLVMQGGVALVVARVDGDVTELWYCPAIEWEWPGGSTSRYEADCDPWEPGVKGETRWSRWVRLPTGENTITVRLYKGRRLLAVGTVTIRVVGF